LAGLFGLAPALNCYGFLISHYCSILRGNLDHLALSGTILAYMFGGVIHRNAAKRATFGATSP
jgi:hypothetical protein